MTHLACPASTNEGVSWLGPWPNMKRERGREREREREREKEGERHAAWQQPAGEVAR